MVFYLSLKTTTQVMMLGGTSDFYITKLEDVRVSTLLHNFLSLKCCWFVFPFFFFFFWLSQCSQKCTVFRSMTLLWCKRSTALRPFQWRRGPGLQAWWRHGRPPTWFCFEFSQEILQPKARSQARVELNFHILYICTAVNKKVLPLSMLL